ncbi:MAG: hypothetical protein AAGA33_06910 [Pseudomonadota bacterium]
MTLFRYKEISYRRRSGQIYLVTTLVTAVTALMIFQHGVFGVAHIMAVAALVALATGMLAEAVQLFGKWSRQIQAVSFSATILFHCLPAVTDSLLRLPVGDPILTSINDPIMKMSHLAVFVLFLVGVVVQLRWISRSPAAA